MCVGVDAIVTGNASTSESLRMNVIMNALSVTPSGQSVCTRAQPLRPYVQG